MGIRVQHGDMSGLARSAERAAQAKIATRMQEQTLRYAAQIQSQKNAIRMVEVRMEAQFQSDVRQQEFELNKINIRQQNDFMKAEDIRVQRMQAGEDNRMREEQMVQAKQMQKQSEYDLRIKAIGDSEVLSDSEKDRAKFNEYNKFQGGTTRMSLIEPEEDVSSFPQKKSAMGYIEKEKEREEKETSWLKALLPGGASGEYEQTEEQKVVLSEARAVISRQPDEAGKIRVRNKETGQMGTIPAQEFNPELYERL